MKYLYKNHLDGAAHLWDDGDTYCRQFSTGGLNPRKYRVFDETGGRRICKMCNDVFEEYSGYRIENDD